MADRPLPPEPAPTEPCTYGCIPSTDWRHYPTGWERACDSHCGGRLAVHRGDFVPDEAIVWREGRPR